MEINIKRLLMVGTMACVMPLAAMAQSGTNLYNQGVAKFNKGAYTEAITLFEKSKIIDGSQKNKQACDAMIRKCQNAMKSKTAKSSTADGQHSKEHIAGYSKKKDVEAVQDKSRVTDQILSEILDDNFEIKKKEKYDWLHLSKAAGKVIIQCDDNHSTSQRTATYYVTYNGKTEEYQVVQKGRNDGKTVSGDSPVQPSTGNRTATIQRKETYLLLRGLGSGTPKIKDCSPWIKPLDYKLLESKGLKKFWKNLTKKKDKIAALGEGEAAFSVELFKGDEATREGFIDIEGVGRYKIIQASSK